jgi:hypothetical protein
LVKSVPDNRLWSRVCSSVSSKRRISCVFNLRPANFSQYPGSNQNAGKDKYARLHLSLSMFLRACMMALIKLI